MSNCTEVSPFLFYGVSTSGDVDGVQPCRDVAFSFLEDDTSFEQALLRQM